MLYNLVLMRNKPYSNAAFEHVPEDVTKQWDADFSEEGMAALGMRWVVYCDTTWSNEEYSVFTVVSYKDLSDRIQDWKRNEANHWWRYGDMVTLLGTSENAPKTPDFPNPIYQLFMVRADPVTTANVARETKVEPEARWAKWRESMQRRGACMLLYCETYWANNEYLGFGINAFPDIEACQGHASDLLEINWPQYCAAFTLLGTSH